LYLRDGRRIRTVARVGDDLPGIGRITNISDERLRGDAVFFRAFTEDERTVIARHRRGRVRLLIATGDSIPGTGPIVSLDEFDAAGDTLVFSTSQGVVLRRGARTELISFPSTLSPLANPFVWRLRLIGSTVVMGASTSDPVASGIYVARGTRFVPYLEIGQPVPGFAGTIVSYIADFQAEGRRRLLLLELVGDDVGLFLATGARVVRLTTEIPGDVRTSRYPDSTVLGAGLVLVGGDGVVHVATPKTLQPVVESGETTAVGTLDFQSYDEDYGQLTYALAGRNLVFATRLVGGDSRAALLIRRVGSTVR